VVSKNNKDTPDKSSLDYKHPPSSNQSRCHWYWYSPPGYFYFGNFIHWYFQSY